MSQFSGRKYRSYGFRGSSRGGRRAWGFLAPRDLPPTLGVTVDTILLDQIHGNRCAPEDAKITHCEYVASYNIQEPKTSVIFVPGTPPRWTPPREAAALKEDSGDYYRDNNAAYFPSYPMEPAVRAVFACDPNFNCAGIDIVTCASTLGNLMRFVLGSHQGFCFTVQMIGKTAFFLRRELSPKDLIKGITGYGYAFPEAYTTWNADVKGSVTHQRIIKYRLGGKSILLRFESDGYIGEHDGSKHQQTSEEPNYSIEDLLQLGLDSKKQDDSALPISVQRAGRIIPQPNVFDLKTRSYRKKDQDILADELPRLWVRQVSKFILAFHDTGVFNDVRVEDVGGRVQFWESENERQIRKLAEVFDRIIDTAMAVQSHKLELRSTGRDPGRMELRHISQDEITSQLPEDVERLWIQNSAVGGE
ncbi:hypothetical protein M433DRAFT_8213 [Acidomyces richmondensis BFW]|nr:MAG: hypothetical protein FE78DRAFT_136504 [Acidomyces sp. 'richmondensis']KYG41110.1 hypothetical protein M433DRAFT_8213 [Acidomyces richmondensis BFW]